MAFLAGARLSPPDAQPLLGFLVAGFLLLVAGLAILTARRQSPPLRSAHGTRRALFYALVYALCSGCFARVVAPALLAREHSPWLLALGDVMFVTLGLFVWVMAIAEGHAWRDYGFRGGRPTRFALTLALGVGIAFFYSARRYAEVTAGIVTVTPDSLVFALVFAIVGSALPEELLFRGYLQGSLDPRTNRWARVVVPALAFTAMRSLRFLPGVDVPAASWLFHVVGISLPLGLWWGLMRDLAGGSLWPGLLSHFILEFGPALASASPTAAGP
ncbi:MAG TPA: CPBP family intramembrane glutamic endopeptidase [Candidatus Limnocylindria bacterium]|nr:CPBP family intramembrane glutamic endopeptidase [Candidatus Limnocylindria bacterium]